MKLIVAILPQEKLSAVRAAQIDRDVRHITVSEVLDITRDDGPLQIYRGREFRRPVSKVRLEVLVSDSEVDETARTIRQACSSRDPNGVKEDQLFVIALEEAPRPSGILPLALRQRGGVGVTAD